MRPSGLTFDSLQLTQGIIFAIQAIRARLCWLPTNASELELLGPLWKDLWDFTFATFWMHTDVPLSTPSTNLLGIASLVTENAVHPVWLIWWHQQGCFMLPPSAPFSQKLAANCRRWLRTFPD